MDKSSSQEECAKVPGIKGNTFYNTTPLNDKNCEKISFNTFVQGGYNLPTSAVCIMEFRLKLT